MHRFVLALLLVFPFRAMTQLVLTPGCLLHVQSDAQLLINDSLKIEPLAELILSGEIRVGKSVFNRGLFELTGNLILGEHLVQSGVMNAAATSRLITTGNIHLLSGDSSIALGIWENSGSGIRRILRTVSVQQLLLDSVRLFTGNFALRLQGSTSNSLSRTDGWVISGLNGAFYRTLPASNALLFPVGDSLRYRPVLLETPGASVIGLRYAEVSAVSEGLPVFLSDPLICSIDPQFNYRIYPESGAVSLNATFPPSFFNGQAGWAFRGLNAGDGWSRLNSNLLPPGDSLDIAFSDQLQGPGALSLYLKRPEIPQILGPDSICASTSQTTYSLANPEEGVSYLWNITGGTLFAQNGSEAVIDWAGGSSGNIAVVASASSGCSSLGGNLPVTLFPLPEVSISTVAPQFPFPGEVWNFSAEGFGAIAYSWEAGSGESGIGSPISFVYDAPGDYLVELIAESEHGCRDTAKQKLTVVEGLEFPDSFSPNGDGVNDVFLLKNGGLKDFSLQIFDRWGNRVFETMQNQTFWDGRTPSGTLVPTGTYFYLLRAVGASAVYEKRSTVTVFY